MKRISRILVLVSMLNVMFVCYAFADTINIPADYSTIQEGLNAAVDFDTVLVATGTYSENISWPSTNGIKLIGEDRETTIIDGNQQTSVIRFEEDLGVIIDTTTVIDNFTIRNGNSQYGGGIYCNSVSPSLINLIITDNSAIVGGGFCCFFESNPNFNNVIFTNNSANSGGGIYCTSPLSNLNLKEVSIKNNFAYNVGGGIYCDYSNLIFSSESRCNIFSNTLESSKGYGADIFFMGYDTIHVVVDTFTVMNPTGYYASPVNNFTFDILHSVVNDLINSDVYVSVDGDNANSGTSPDEPFKTIKYALSRIYSDSMNINTIHLSEGVYSNSTNGERFPIKWCNYVNLSGSVENETILDAEQSGRVMEFIKISDAYIQNITITGGSYNGSGAGIYCKDNSSPVFENVKITNNSGEVGGGICCLNSNLYLVNVDVTNNSANYEGGGIFSYYSSIILDNVNVSTNSAEAGGGFYFWNDRNSSLENVSIKYNTAQEAGSGIYCDASTFPILSSQNRCNIFSNTVENSKGFGVDIFSKDCDTINIVVDTFTVINPTDYYASPVNNFTFDILHGFVNNLINSDMYVSADGDNANSGTSPDAPFKTIKYALSRIYSDSMNINTIHLAPGVYSNSTNGEIFPIMWSNYVNLSGSAENGSILDANQSARVMEFIQITDASIQNITITGGLASYGGGIYCDNSKPTLDNVNIIYNSADQGGGIICSSSDIVFINSIVSYNTGNYGIYNDPYNPGEPIITYSDFFNNEGGNFYGVNDLIGVNVTTNANGDSCDVFYNIQLDPLFVDPLNGDYHLSWTNFPIQDSTMSPCIDAGDPTSPLDPDGTIADMGACYFNQNVSVDDPQEISSYMLINYPNPISINNNVLSVSFSIHKPRRVKIQLFNIKGQLVSTIINEDKNIGDYTITHSVNNLSSGIYFTKLSIDGVDREIKKVVLLK